MSIHLQSSVSNMKSWLAIFVLGFLFACGEPAVETRAPKSSQDFLAEANATVTTIPAAETIALRGDSMVAFVDVREQVELDEYGWIPGSVHVPRGLLEFAIDPSSARHKEVFSSGKQIVFYCSTGRRSAFAAQRAVEMGLADVTHMGGGLSAWVEAGGAVEKPDGMGTP